MKSIMAGTFIIILYTLVIAIFIVLIFLMVWKHLKAGNIKGVLKEPMLLFAFGFLFLMGSFLIKETCSGEVAALISHILIVVSIILNGTFIYIISKQIKAKKKK
jgi:hypothetical protein